MTRTRALIATAIAVLAVAAAGCGGDDNGSSSGSDDVSGTVSVMGIWSGDEQASFEAVIAGFNEQYPNVTVNYTSAGDQLPTQLSTAVEGGNPPDIALVAQPGLMKDLVNKGALKSLEFARDDVEKYFSTSTELGEVDGTLYGLIFKASNKSLVWYNVPVLSDAGVDAPETWDDLTTAATTVGDSGVPAWSIGAADGWTLTDLFENIYLRSAGADMYDQLSAHEIPWTDQSVKDALGEMAKVVGDSNNIAGGTSGALQTDFPTSVTNVFADPPKAAMVSEGDFVAGVITDSTSAEPDTGFNVFAFPSINDSPPTVEISGDLVILFTDNDATQALVTYLASPEAAGIWAERGGFGSLNKELDTSVYPDAITKSVQDALGAAEVSRFDLSDLQPAAFGGTVGQGLFKQFQDFVQNPSDIDGITQQMEDSATKAYASSG
jgi:alpha-glucoside transport system substrate-binding protein